MADKVLPSASPAEMLDLLSEQTDEWKALERHFGPQLWPPCIHKL